MGCHSQTAQPIVKLAFAGRLGKLGSPAEAVPVESKRVNLSIMLRI